MTETRAFSVVVLAAIEDVREVLRWFAGASPYFVLLLAVLGGSVFARSQSLKAWQVGVVRSGGGRYRCAYLAAYGAFVGLGVTAVLLGLPRFVREAGDAGACLLWMFITTMAVVFHVFVRLFMRAAAGLGCRDANSFLVSLALPITHLLPPIGLAYFVVLDGRIRSAIEHNRFIEEQVLPELEKERLA